MWRSPLLSSLFLHAALVTSLFVRFGSEPTPLELEEAWLAFGDDGIEIRGMGLGGGFGYRPEAPACLDGGDRS